MIGKTFVSVCLLSAVSVFAAPSDTVSCKNHCYGTTLYTSGYKTCVGSDCVCEYTEIQNAAECPATPPPVKSEKDSVD